MLSSLEQLSQKQGRKVEDPSITRLEKMVYNAKTNVKAIDNVNITAANIQHFTPRVVEYDYTVHVAATAAYLAADAARISSNAAIDASFAAYNAANAYNADINSAINAASNAAVNVADNAADAASYAYRVAADASDVAYAAYATVYVTTNAVNNSNASNADANVAALAAAIVTANVAAIAANAATNAANEATNVANAAANLASVAANAANAATLATLAAALADANGVDIADDAVKLQHDNIAKTLKDYEHLSAPLGAEDPPILECGICFVNRKNIVFNCGHMFCGKCATSHNKHAFERSHGAAFVMCPQCSTKIVTVSPMYF